MPDAKIIQIHLEDLPPAITLYDADIFVVDQLGSDGYTKKLTFKTLYTSLSTSFNFVRSSGDVMTGPLFLNTTSPVSSLQAASKGYVDKFVPKTGATMTGGLYLNTSTPTTPTQAASKGYVDGKFLPLSGGTITGYVTLANDPVSAGHVVSKGYVDAVATPAGAIMNFAMSATPTGWLWCNGAEISRTTYSNLFNAIGTTFGTATSATFTLPDMRGEFQRGWDGGRGIDTGRMLGSYQAGEVQSHTHAPLNGTGFAVANTLGTFGIGGTGIALQSTTGASGGTETRPRNIALYTCIKY